MFLSRIWKEGGSNVDRDQAKIIVHKVSRPMQYLGLDKANVKNYSRNRPTGL
jgi:hypothetical protein